MNLPIHQTRSHYPRTCRSCNSNLPLHNVTGDRKSLTDPQ